MVWSSVLLHPTITSRPGLFTWLPFRIPRAIPHTQPRNIATASSRIALQVAAQRVTLLKATALVLPTLAVYSLGHRSQKLGNDIFERIWPLAVGSSVPIDCLDHRIPNALICPGLFRIRNAMAARAGEKNDEESHQKKNICLRSH